MWRARVGARRIPAWRGPLKREAPLDHGPEAGRRRISTLPASNSGAATQNRTNSRGAPEWALGRLPAPPRGLRTPQPNSVHPVPVPAAPGVLFGELAGAPNLRRALPAPYPLPAPRFQLGWACVRPDSPLLFEPAGHWFSRDLLRPDETAPDAPHLPLSERGAAARVTSRLPRAPRAPSHLITLATRAGRGEAGGGVTARSPPPQPPGLWAPAGALRVGRLGGNWRRGPGFPAAASELGWT